MADFSSLYSEKVMDHFQHPRNVGEIKDADGVGTVGNKVCGDVMRLFIRVAKIKSPSFAEASPFVKISSFVETPEDRSEDRSAGRQKSKPSTTEDGVEIIEDVKFQTLGCGAAIATSSIATEMIKGKPLSEAVEITNKAIAEALDGLPPAKMHCSVLAAEAVRKAVEDYKNKSKVKDQISKTNIR